MAANDTAMLDDIKNHFNLVMENYPTVYADYKMNPHLPSAMTAHDKMESNLTSIYRRMFSYQADIDKQMEEKESGLSALTTQNSKLNTMLATRKMVSKKNAMAKKSVKMPLKESFQTITGLAEDNTIAPNDNTIAPNQNKISLVKNAELIEKSMYYYNIARIIYLLVGIIIVSYFIFKTIGSPESTILADAKMKADELNQTTPTQ